MEPAARPGPTRPVGAHEPKAIAAPSSTPPPHPSDLELELHLFAQEWIRDQARARWARHDPAMSEPSSPEVPAANTAPPPPAPPASAALPAFKPAASMPISVPLPSDLAPHAPSAPIRRARPQRLRRILVTSAFIIIVIACAGALVALALSQERPTWWRSVDAADPAVVATAEKLENGVATLLTQARPPNATGDPAKPWTVALPASDANAWLNARLRKWLLAQSGIDFQWPEDLLELQVQFADDRIHVGARIRQGDGQQILTASISPEFRADGAIWMPADSVSIGRLKVPARWMLPSAGSTKGGRDARGAHSAPNAEPAHAENDHGIENMPHTREVLAALSGAMPALADPIIRLGDGRRVRVLALSARDGRLLITCRTETRETAAR